MATVSDVGDIAASAQGRPAQGVSLLRLYLLRFTYLLIAGVLGSEIWPLVFHHRPWSDVMHSVAVAMLAGVTALAALGLRYPLKLLPLLLLETIWKSLWLLMIAVPMWRAGAPMDANTADTTQACLMGAIFLVVIPWGYVWRTFVTAPGDRWW
jgi:hypothetical protein